MDGGFTTSVRVVDLTVAFEPELGAGSEQIFANELLARFPTTHSCSLQEKEGKKRGKNISKNEEEKCLRQARRNARERGRKARLNAAFQVLRSMVPQDLESTNHEHKKLTQVEILKLAKNYICSLTTILKANKDIYQGPNQFWQNSFQTCSY